LYAIIEDEHLARVPPTLLGENYDKAVEEVTRETLQGTLVDYVPDKNSRNDMLKCYIVSILKIEKLDYGIIVHGDGGVYQKINYKALAFIPKNNEVVEGVIVSVVPKIGAFVKFGPFEGLLHVGQIMDDRIDMDETQNRLVGKESNKDLRVGDKVRVRIVMLNLASSSVRDRRIGFTMKQPGLGKLQWLNGEPVKEPYEAKKTIQPKRSGTEKPKKVNKVA
jgi:DNA-directed RNA polymerase subunit E'